LQAVGGVGEIAVGTVNGDVIPVERTRVNAVGVSVGDGQVERGRGASGKLAVEDGGGRGDVGDRDGGGSGAGRADAVGDTQRDSGQGGGQSDGGEGGRGAGLVAARGGGAGLAVDAVAVEVPGVSQTRAGAGGAGELDGRAFVDGVRSAGVGERRRGGRERRRQGVLADVAVAAVAGDDDVIVAGGEG